MLFLLAFLLQAPAPQPAAVPPVSAESDAPVPVLTARIVARYPHDATAFTQGLLWHEGNLYESTGLEGRSEIRRVRLADGKVLGRARLPTTQFGEGMTLWGRQLVSLTWKSGIAYRWDIRTLKRVAEARFVGEGWGLAGNGTQLIHSDGTPTLRFLDPATLAVKRQVTVTLRGKPVSQLNELEVIDGAVLANVWHTPYLLRIDPATGRTTAVVDLRAVVAEIKTADPEAVANGIAWDPARRRLFVTGKLWPTLFEIALTPAG
ncbi:glutaminyl-peptide cyclotransferase [Sphingomonas sp.]|jgi:glutamine cyclotransferase|uniref:glutaminyl-peptide cyclotransferase n=1 Tax=Sphingomonas sp. TaxID=28214 RepID=UPI002D80EFA4|nr:glutaminyl-peptide cyclotransferase [Sphingomonas sp.]HEU0043245.1 glutaminyl-peptide cyclotransferase [Sphingomonas sp.]